MSAANQPGTTTTTTTTTSVPVVAVSSTTSNNEGGGDDVVVWWCGTCLFDFDNDTHVPMILEVCIFILYVMAVGTYCLTLTHKVRTLHVQVMC